MDSFGGNESLISEKLKAEISVANTDVLQQWSKQQKHNRHFDSEIF